MNTFRPSLTRSYKQTGARPKLAKTRMLGVRVRLKKAKPVKARTNSPGQERTPHRNRRGPGKHWRKPFPGRLDERSYITKSGRVRLFGRDYTNFRMRVAVRAKEICECGCGRPALYKANPHRPSDGEVAHNEHGPRKSDELSEVKWMRHECHMNSHNCGGKPCPKKAKAA